MALETLDLLDKFKVGGFGPGYPATVRTFYAPVDEIQEVLLSVISSAQKSIVGAMYGYADSKLNQIILGALGNKAMYVQLSLDSTQAAGKGEQALLADWQNELQGNSISIGRSEHGAIMHLKEFVIDGLDVITGSTNWSDGAERKQDNQLTVIRDPLVAAEARLRLDIIHDAQLKQMAKARFAA